MSGLTVEQTAAMFIYVADAIENDIDDLNAADQAIGDGDHGEGIRRGMRAAKEKLEAGEFDSVESVVKTIGIRMMATMGGASGAIFGTLFRGGSKGLAGYKSFSSAALATMLDYGLSAVQERGKAQVGDKTMLDALAPAAQRAREIASAPLDEVLSAAAEAAQEGMEATKNYVAKMGRAKTLGERTIGHADPGSISVYLILKYMTDYVLSTTR